ncbi:M67 family metallopeptidase [Reichenbachiella versicolor]|uniref:M67 family metallopeptidase n=1 Tax=Reichenbachiella versicolor TaxID=1821036 RepID=UPI000D6EAC0D|nr:M67 family metallopeptidase [Reichenbachiella versicolor]
MQITVSQEIMENMKKHALEDFPNECVGFMIGDYTENEKTVLEYLRIKNSQEGDKRRRFQVSPSDYIKAEKLALETKRTLLGVHHSHPLHPAIPSEHDLKQALPFFSYIISSVSDTEVSNVTSWSLNDAGTKFEEETITLN